LTPPMFAASPFARSAPTSVGRRRPPSTLLSDAPR
jgi:hypothetical protein